MSIEKQLLDTANKVIQRNSVVSTYVNNPTNENWDKLIKIANQLGLSDGQPDPDLDYNFACEECKTKTTWSMNNVVNAGTPICSECGDDMELQ